jgi:hypothetical protein
VYKAGQLGTETFQLKEGEHVAKKGKPAELIISKSRTKDAAKKCNVSSDFYGALDKKVRELIAAAEARAIGNKRKTLKPQDL